MILISDEKFQALLQTLIDIRDRVLDHPLCDIELYERRDVQALCDTGGDVCDWTMIAIIADDALKKAKCE